MLRKNDNLLLVILLLTTAVLVTLLIGTIRSTPAQADTPDRMGQYIMVTGAMGSNDLVYIVDVPKKRLIVYYVDGVNNNIRVADDRIDLGRVFR